MSTAGSQWFWKVWATALLLVLARLAFAGAAPAAPSPAFSLVRPLHAQEVAIGANAICTSAASGTVLYCWTINPGPTGPAIKWYGAFKVPNS